MKLESIADLAADRGYGDELASYLEGVASEYLNPLKVKELLEEIIARSFSSRVTCMANEALASLALSD